MTEREMWLRVGEAADRMGVSTTKLRSMADKGLVAHRLIPPPAGSKRNPERRFHVHEVDRIIRAMAQDWSQPVYVAPDPETPPVGPPTDISPIEREALQDDLFNPFKE